MHRYRKPFIFALILLAVGYGMWLWTVDDISIFKKTLIHFKHYCVSHPWTGYFVYSGILSIILFAGLPLASVAMLIAGVLYNFWEATTLIMVCRLLAAIIAFMLVRMFMEQDIRPSRRAPYIVQKFERHPRVALLLARLTPIPDSLVNYTLAAAPIRHRDYVFLSLVGMVPLTMFCVWLGNELGSINQVIRWLQ